MNAPPACASSGIISGIGFARAKMIESLFMVAMSCLSRRLALLTPMNTSVSIKASFRLPDLFSKLVKESKDFFASVRSSRSLHIIPFVSQINISFTGSQTSPVACSTHLNNLAMAIPAAPAPLMTTFSSFNRFPASFAEFINPANTTTAVPCWSS